MISYIFLTPVFIVCFFCAVVPAKAAPTCPFPGITISDSSPFIGVSSPQIGMDNAGNAIAIWSEDNYELEPSIQTSIQFATLLHGGNWSNPGSITTYVDDGSNASPQIAVSRSTGNAVAIWQEKIGGVSYLRSSSCLFGGNWSPVVDVASSTDRILFPEIAINDSGYAVAVWQQNTGSNIYLKSADFLFGSGWSTSIVVVSTTSNLSRQKVAVDPDGVAYAVWINNSVNDVQAATLPVGGVWTTPDNLASSAYFGPDVAVGSAGFAVATWSSLVESDFFIQVSIYQSGWTTPVIISTTIGTTVGNPNIAIDLNDNVSVVWEDQPNIFTQVIKSAYRPMTTGSWEVPRNITNDGFSYRPEVTFDANQNTYAVWTFFNESGGRSIEFATALAGGAWTSPSCNLLSPLSDTSDFSHVVAALDGNVAIIWLNASQNTIQATGLPLLPPAITNISPMTGSISGGNAVFINGANFYDVTVQFGAENFAASITLISPTQLVVIVPEGVFGVVDVIVTTPSGVATLNQSYTYIAPICWQR